MSRQIPKNPIAVALRKRHGQTTKVMRDRRQPRGGARNRQDDWRKDGWL